MRAVHITRHAGPAAVEVVELDEPTAEPDSVVIDVRVAGVTYPEVAQSRGEYHLRRTLPFVPGAEVAGTVRSAPSNTGLTAGQRVAAFPGTGGYAETVAVPPTAVFPLPDNVSLDTGAALPMNYLTMHFALVRRAHLQPGDTVLVHGAAGGIGTAAVQLATALGARAIAVVSGPDKIDTAKAAGSDEVVLADDFDQAVRKLTGERGVDLVVDPVGGDRLTGSLNSLAREGRYLVVGAAGGHSPQVTTDSLMRKNLDLSGIGWGAFWQEQPSFLQQQWTDLLPLLQAGKLTPVLGRRFPLEQAAQALLELDQRRAQGKVLLDVR
ncbi:NADPH:quinone oxidoreductase family protein [Streptomyces reniochalinae]|uniref:NADPH:quinone oxidoreductase family protein n=1 Tax=Streptomyces reniochalinae TaxID=2250578 RepID=A0A367E5G9_9ACTN|nr:NADPH:quinone oxidoreductase family protein [Streptomyces reniochalinae]RCG13251.1 NADPH:quinone oxidoreductase family protein [Streptomyces reniochalinae]